MTRRSGQRAKTPPGYDARHAKPGAPGPGALIGTAAKAVPVTLVAGAASSALALSGTASAATVVPAGLAGASLANSGTADLTAAKTAASHIVTKRAHHAGHRSAYTVVSGDTLSRISARFCGTPAHYLSLAGASGITNPDLIFPGQTIKLRCHAAPAQVPPAPVSASGGAHRSSAAHAEHRAPGRHARSGRHARTAARLAGNVSTAGMAAFESCVISRESGGNPHAVNPTSGAGGLYQFLPSTWADLGYASAYPGGAQSAPVSVQRAAFARLFAEAGTSPWRPYDGC